MIGWIIVTAVTLLLCVACWVIAHKISTEWSGDEAGWQVGGFLLACAFLVFVCILIFTPPSVRVQTGRFESQKTYIESHVSKSALEDATITNTKIEMNTWLFNAQQAQEVYGIFSFYPESVWELEPIQ